VPKLACLGWQPPVPSQLSGSLQAVTDELPQLVPAGASAWLQAPLPLQLPGPRHWLAAGPQLVPAGWWLARHVPLPLQVSWFEHTPGPAPQVDPAGL
jgi:hypothetical protein